MSLLMKLIFIIQVQNDNKANHVPFLLICLQNMKNYITSNDNQAAIRH